MSESVPPKKSVPQKTTPAKPVPAGVASPARRTFVINWLKFAWIAFAAATATALATTLRFLFPNVLFEPKSTFKAGKPDDYEIGKVDTRWKGKYNVWIIRTVEGMYALLAVYSFRLYTQLV